MLSASPSSCTGFSETVAESQELEGMQLGVLLYTASEWLEKGSHLLCPESTLASSKRYFLYLAGSNTVRRVVRGGWEVAGGQVVFQLPLMSPFPPHVR